MGQVIKKLRMSLPDVPDDIKEILQREMGEEEYESYLKSLRLNVEIEPGKDGVERLAQILPGYVTIFYDNGNIMNAFLSMFEVEYA